jgi:allophanate hydrolase subunit 2
MGIRPGGAGPIRPAQRQPAGRQPPTTSALECSLLGPQLEFQSDALVAVTGARMQPRVDGSERPLDTAFMVRSGQVLSFDYPKAGARSYLAIAGGIDVPVVLESRSTYALARWAVAGTQAGQGR